MSAVINGYTLIDNDAAFKAAKVNKNIHVKTDDQEVPTEVAEDKLAGLVFAENKFYSKNEPLAASAAASAAVVEEANAASAVVEEANAAEQANATSKGNNSALIPVINAVMDQMGDPDSIEKLRGIQKGLENGGSDSNPGGAGGAGGRRRTRRHHKKGDKKSRRQSKKGGKKHRKSAKKGSSKSKRSRRYSSRK
jgi:hypothetical protein